MVSNDNLGAFERFRCWVSALFASEQDIEQPAYDQSWLRHLRYEYIETEPKNYDGQVRCNLCGRLFEDMEDCVDHVAEHDSQGDSVVDPFFRKERNRLNLFGDDDATSENTYRTPKPVSRGYKWIIPEHKRKPYNRNKRQSNRSFSFLDPDEEIDTDEIPDELLEKLPESFEKLETEGHEENYLSCDACDEKQHSIIKSNKGPTTYGCVNPDCEDIHPVADPELNIASCPRRQSRHGQIRGNRRDVRQNQCVT